MSEGWTDINTNQTKSDESMIVEIYDGSIPDALATNGGIISEDHPRLEEMKALGRKIKPARDVHKKLIPEMVDVGPGPYEVHRDAVMIAVQVDRETRIVREITDEDKRKWPRHWAAYEANHDSRGMIGLPLRQWGLLTPAIVETLVHLGIKTVEQLAGIPDQRCQEIRGAYEWREKARNFLEQAKPQEALRAELVTRDEKIAALTAKVEELIAAKSAPVEAPKRRGRPPKNAEA